MFEVYNKKDSASPIERWGDPKNNPFCQILCGKITDKNPNVQMRRHGFGLVTGFSAKIL